MARRGVGRATPRVAYHVALHVSFVVVVLCLCLHFMLAFMCLLFCFVVSSYVRLLRVWCVCVCVRSHRPRRGSSPQL